MTEKAVDKAEKTQIEGLIKEDKVIITNQEGIEEFHNTSFIGTIDTQEDGKNVLTLSAVEILLLLERKRILLWEENDKSKKLLDQNFLFY